ncbi:MAG: Fic/DOC family N-terminal domain-containing protein [Candidatus Omnitrophota bacterium]|nr:Fic/DOC family N-terminal domain-containing protein [Candidatus Omnitrophota bacterium]
MKKPYAPQSLPLDSLDWVRFVSLIGPANAELARYDGILQGILNPRVLLSPLTTNEAVLSSKIEGTQASLQEVLEFEASPDLRTEKREDILEILNYRKAMQLSVDWLKSKPITLNMIKDVHNTLLDSVRGKDKARGQFRRLQNWIGKPGTPMEEAMYIPPDPMFLMDHLSNFEKYIHFDEKDRLVQLAIVHAQFEIIHPFLDGNGRLGRILIPLFLYEKKALGSPMFYISEYLESHRDEYYARLNAITSDGQWNDWIEFFLKAVLEQAKNNSAKAKAILDLYNAKKDKIMAVTHSQYTVKILDTLFKTPIFNMTDFIKISGIPKASATRILNILKKEEMLAVLHQGRGRSPGVMAFTKLLKICG